MSGPSDRISDSLLHRQLWLVPHAILVRPTQSRILTLCIQATVHTLESWTVEQLRRLPDTPPQLHRYQQRWLIPSLLREAVEEGELPTYAELLDARGILDAALGFLEELRSEGVFPATLTQLTRSPLSDDGPSSPRLTRQRQLALLYARYHDRLKACGHLDHEEAYHYLADQLKDPPARLRLPDAVILDRLGKLTAGQGHLVQALLKHADAVVPPPPTITDQRPPGLQHLQRLHAPSSPSENQETVATGVRFHQSPGMLGEARLAARAVHRWLAQGMAPQHGVLTARRIEPWLELLSEVFAEYRIPLQTEICLPLGKDPRVATLIRAARLPEEDWPFAELTALLRSTLFLPRIKAFTADPTLAQRSEVLLRLLGESRGEENYLHGVATWATTPPPRLEDESAEESRRKRQQRLAQECLPFLTEFFQLWHAFPREAEPEGFVTALEQLADNLGLTATPAAGQTSLQSDPRPWQAFWTRLNAWARDPLLGPPLIRRCSRGRFLRDLEQLINHWEESLQVDLTPAVQLLRPESACHTECERLIILGLGEGSFPDLAPPESLLDDSDRSLFHQAGLPLADPGSRLDSEWQLFQQLLVCPSQELILSYAVVDSRGQPLLPSSFLQVVEQAFTSDSVLTLRRQMLLEGYWAEPPLADGEQRCHVAAVLNRLPHDASPRRLADTTKGLPADLRANLVQARQMAQQRFAARQFTVYDGLLDATRVAATLNRRFGPDQVLSPTALETYIACPYKFMLQHVLFLEPLEEPSEEIEHTRRGAAFHRALARFHKQVLAEQSHYLLQGQVPPSTTDALQAEMDRAIEEYVERTSSPATKMLWRLEGQRLRRSVGRYAEHWQRFMQEWQAVQAVPQPYNFELDVGLRSADLDPEAIYFELPLLIKQGDLRCRIGGRIDRIDVAELPDGKGFWILDYKTGRSSHYTARGLEDFSRLQLTLYALAVQRVVFAGEPSRPLGLAYWLVTDTGPKRVLPSGRNGLNWYTDPQAWEKFRDRLEVAVLSQVQAIRQGRFPLNPREDNCTQTCGYGQVCRIAQCRGLGKHLPDAEEDA